MKKNMILLIISFGLWGSVTVQADEMKDFIEDVNAAWTNRNYSAISSNINTRLQGNSNDVLALGLKMHYYVFVDLSPVNARAAATAFTNVVFLSDRYDLEPLAYSIADNFQTFPLAETNEFTQEQRNTFHNVMPEFPGIIRCVSLAVMFNQTNTTIFKLDIESSNPGTGVMIEMNPTDNAGRSGTNTVFSRIFTKETPITLTAPETAGGNDFDEWQRDLVMFSTNRIVKFKMPGTNVIMKAVYE